MKTVFKYAVQIGQPYPTAVELPHGCVVLHVASQTWGFLTFWAEVPLTQDPEPVTRLFQVFGTGHHVPDNAQWLGTVLVENGFVWHLYEIPTA